MRSIDPSRWPHVRRIFEAALELAVEERDAWIARECGVDDLMAREVRELLHADETARRRIELSPGGADAYAAALLAGSSGVTGPIPDASSPDPRIGTTIGRFRVLARLGEGGMGVVYEAEQESPRRRVALKLIRGPASADPLGAKLFEREIASLGRLRHPGIGVIHEAGVTGDGAPYFAMELVNGQPLDQHLRGGAPRGSGEERLPPALGRNEQRERLALFLEICDAIQYAHQRGVIHRDLKPSNILAVAPDPHDESSGKGGSSSRGSRGHSRIKVLDFGLARIIDPDSTLTSVHSDAPSVLGTLSYMSPEQARGNPDEIDVRSDIYALGVVLYEMLCGRLPIDLRHRGMAEALRRIEAEPPRVPSTLVPSLRGDLDTVLLKALAKERDARYQSVEALAEDVRRVLQDLPILARRPSLAAQLLSLARRHRAASALAAALLLAIVGFGAIMTVLYGRAVDAEHRARRDGQRAARVSEFMEQLFRVSDPSVSRGDTITARQMLDQGARRIETELAAEPEVQASLMQAMGSSYLGLGLYEPADDLFGRAHARVVRIHGATSADAVRSLVRMAEARFQRGAFGSADSLLDAAERARAEGAVHAAGLQTDILDVRAALRMDQGRLAESESLKTIVLADRRRRLGTRDLETLRTMANLGSSLLSLNKYAEAVDTLEVVLRERERILGELHPDVITALNELAYANRRFDRLTRAESLFVRALALAERVRGSEHPDNAYLWNNLGLTRRQMKRFPEAESALRRAVEIRERALPADHPLLAWTLDNLALVLTQEGKLDDAERTVARAIAIASKTVPADHIDRAFLQNNLASLREAQGRLREAKAIRLATIPIYEKTYGPESPGLATTLGDLSLTLEKLGEIPAAIRHRERQLAMIEKRRGPDHPATVAAREALARLERLASH